MSLILALGSNLNDKEVNLSSAIDRLNSVFGKYLSISNIYISAPCDKTQQPDYLNICVQYSTPDIGPQVVLDKCLSIEKQLGRVRKEKWGPRIIDIDIIFIGSLNINTQSLTIPHPFINDRSFVVRPLMELACFSTLEKEYSFNSSFADEAIVYRKFS